jgi:uracil phosphoribosyltransferase
MPNIFPSIHPLVAHKVSLLRDKNTEHKKFRELVREIATLLTYEATSDLILYQINIDTPLATTTGKVLSEKICLVPILRAGLGMVEGVWHLMPSAEVWHIGLYRDEYYNSETTYKKIMEYIILKARNGPVGTITLKFDPESNRLENK